MFHAGSHLEGAAFNGHPLGKPRIDRVVLRFIPDDTVAFTNILAENVTLTISEVLNFEQVRLIALVTWRGSSASRCPSTRYFPNLGAIAHLATLKGPEASPTNWNIHEWTWTS